MRLLCLIGGINNSKEKNEFDDENNFFLIRLEIITFIKNIKSIIFY